MGEKKQVTIMVLKVDLQCEKCYKKVKKVLSKFPEIREQAYDEKNNLVIIKVGEYCCSPEKIRDKLCCKGGGAIKSIEIKEPEKPKPAKETEKHKEVKEVVEKPTVNAYWMECYGGHPCQTEYGYGGQAPYIQYDGYYGRPVYDSYDGGRSYATTSYGRPVYDSYGDGRSYATTSYGRPVYDSYGDGRSYATTSNCRPDCFSEENPQACAIM